MPAEALGPVLRAQGRITPGPLERFERELEDFLGFHGYRSPGDDLKTSLRRFQAARGVPSTGRLNHATCRLLNGRRCSHPERAWDADTASEHFAASAFVPPRIAAVSGLVQPEMHVDTAVLAGHAYELVHGRWSRRTLGFACVGAAPHPVGAAAWRAVRRAFRTWSDVGSVRLEERDDPSRAELRVLWTPGPAQDPSSRDPFYGPGNHAAVGYYPYPYLEELAGDLHLDTAEAWSTDGQVGWLDVETTALHEIGHCLGLGHATSVGSVMWTPYKQIQRTLAAEDADELARRYHGVPW